MTDEDTLDRLDIFDGMEGADLVQDTFLFKNLSFDESAELAGAFTVQQFKKGDYLIEENALGESLYLIRSGDVVVVKSDGEKEAELVTLGAGELVGEMSLIESSLTSASVVAKNKVEALVLSKTDLDDLMRDNETLALKVFKAFCFALSERVRNTTQELFELRRSGGQG